MQVKLCPKCGIEKPIEDFAPNKARKDGVQVYCRQCQKEYMTAYRNQNRERLKEMYRKYRQENPEKVKQWSAKFRSIHKEEEKLRHAIYYQKNKEQIQQKHRRYYLRNKQKINQHNAQYYIKNKSWLREIRKAYYRTHREKYKEYLEKRRTRIKETTSAPIKFDEIFEKYNGICAICGKPVNKDEASLDHIIPLSKGGKHIPENVQLTHLKCNLKKYNKLPEEMELIFR